MGNFFMIMEKLIANYDFLKYGGFAMLALAGLPAMYNAARETGWGAAMLVFNIYIILLWIAVRLS